MKLRVIHALMIIVVLLSFGVGLYFYPLLPEQVVSHWNAVGEPDGYSSKLVGLFLLPIISLVIFLAYLIIPRIDPLGRNIELFRKYYDRLMLIIIVFLAYLYCLSVVWNWHGGFSLIRYLAPGFGILFFYLGQVLKYAKRNWSIGIRTPWSLSSDAVWNRTHRFSSVLFKLSGIIAFLGLFSPRAAFSLVIIPVVTAAIISVIYSYYVYWRLAKK